jgi:sialic acid synthase SpsE
LKIDGREIGNEPYIIAELSCNHNGSLDKALDLIDAAKAAGADAVKLQTYTPAELTTPGSQLWDLYTKAQTPREWHHELFLYAKTAGITLFSSAFSVQGVSFLEGLNTPAHKIASAEIQDHDLVNAVLETGKPVIISTGMATESDLDRFDHEPNVILLHCVSHYPARIENANLRAIDVLKSYSDHVGLSDHTPGFETAIAATALGACVIEKHFKLDDDCIDAAYSLNPEQFAAMCKAVRAIHAGMGDGIILPTCQPRQR